MPACWKNLEETQRREISTLVSSFYNDLRGDSNKEPWSIQNLKKYLNLGYVKLVDLLKFRGAYFATWVTILSLLNLLMLFNLFKKVLPYLTSTTDLH